MGVMFLDLSEEQRSRIKELVDSIATSLDSDVKNILIVEDNNTIREAIKNALSKEGFSVIEATDGIQAMKMLVEHTPHLIILDLNMKGMDGLKVLSLLKADQDLKGLPVIVCSGHDTKEIRDRVINAGADEFISKKGTSPAKLAQVAKALFEKRQDEILFSLLGLKRSD